MSATVRKFRESPIDTPTSFPVFSAITVNQLDSAANDVKERDLTGLTLSLVEPKETTFEILPRQVVKLAESIEKGCIIYGGNRFGRSLALRMASAHNATPA